MAEHPGSLIVSENRPRRGGHHSGVAGWLVRLTSRTSFSSWCLCGRGWLLLALCWHRRQRRMTSHKRAVVRLATTTVACMKRASTRLLPEVSLTAPSAGRGADLPESGR